MVSAVIFKRKLHRELIINIVVFLMCLEFIMSMSYVKN